MRHVLRAAIAAATAVLVAVVAAAPASAYTLPPHRRLVAALITPENLPAPWHRVSLGAGDEPTEVSGCTGGGADRSADTEDRTLQYGQQALIMAEEVSVYRTLRKARLDFKGGVASLTGCDDLVVDGHPWTVQRLPISRFADQTALFEMKGFVTTPSGDVPMTIYVGATRLGHHSVTMTLIVGGAIADEDRASVRDGARGLLWKLDRRATTRLGV